MTKQRLGWLLAITVAFTMFTVIAHAHYNWQLDALQSTFMTTAMFVEGMLLGAVLYWFVEG